jgi:hypothetical protein
VEVDEAKILPHQHLSFFPRVSPTALPKSRLSKVRNQSKKMIFSATLMSLMAFTAMGVQGYSLCTTAPFPFEGKEKNLTSIPIVQTQESVNGSKYTVSGEIAITGQCTVGFYRSWRLRGFSESEICTTAAESPNQENSATNH